MWSRQRPALSPKQFVSGLFRHRTARPSGPYLHVKINSAVHEALYRSASAAARAQITRANIAFGYRLFTLGPITDLVTIARFGHRFAAMRDLSIYAVFVTSLHHTFKVYKTAFYNTIYL